ncbi:MAG: serine O-acetyltransferase [Gammaproteobacteria bacterium]|nr:serine O-acetyltransferase [Gammaproteobacteria bacterium]MBQ0839613.1 serine O-acetyltransferase [Gammaproteobacteria bacterium]
MTPQPDILWQEILAEARVFSDDEPVLASFFHAAILSHDSLETALGYTLAETLGNVTLSKLSIRQVFAEVLRADTSISEKIHRDLIAYRERDPACDKFAMPLLYFKGFHALQIHRIGHYLWLHQRQALAVHLQSLCSEVFAVDIHPGATIGGGIMIDHATGLVIGETAVVEDNVSMLHAVTLGGIGNESGDRHPKIRSGVLIAAGAKILGNIEIGEGAKVGAGTLVLESVSPHTTVAGVPARLVGRPREAAPALEMDQRINSTS